jgi:peptide/nickel transport system substrate-binding protein
MDSEGNDSRPSTAAFDDSALSGPVVDRRTTLALLGAAGLSGLAGCASESNEGGTASTDETASATPTPTPSGRTAGGTLQAGWFTGSIDNLDPPYISDQKVFPVMANIFNGLVWLDTDLTIRGDLARDWSVTNGGKTFTFQLREDVTFHNGTEFTAEDVRYTINRTISEETPAAPKLAPLQPVDEGGVVVEDDYTVQLNFETAYAPALVYLTRGPGRAATIVCQEAIEEMGADQYNVTPVGTGPFQVTEHTVGTTLMLEAFDDYFKTDDEDNDLPYLDAVEISPVPDPSSIVNALRGGDLDFASAVPLQKVTNVEDAQDVSVVRMPGVNFSGLSLNNEREPFTSKQVRQGIAKLIDNEAFVENAFFGNGLPDTGPLNKGTEWVWREDKPADQDYNPEEGKRMLEAEGAANASFEITTTQGGLRSAKVIRQQLNEAGLDVELNQVTSGTFGDLLFDSDFDATIIGSGGDPDPDQSLYNFFRLPDEDGVWNFMNYRNQEVHDMLGEQRRQLERSERKATLHDIEDQLIEDVPFAFLYHGDDIAGKHASVKGFDRISGLRYFETVWLDE